ncbi:MAG: TonB family protein [Bacteroidaceae bacterium]|nr:TonB family protein [Bacteroidaceae bacterium]
MEKITKEQAWGLAVTAVAHLLLFLLLWLLVIRKPLPQAEAGVPVILGNTELASGDAYQYTEVNVAPIPSPVTTTVPPPSTSPAEPLVTQADEPTVALPSSDKKQDKKRVETPKKTAEQLEAERRAQEAERQRREAEELARVANSRIAGAFGKGTTMQGRGDAAMGNGTQGSPQGNSQEGVVSGTGGYGSCDLGGRSLMGSLPRPSYNVQEEGRVVVTITVNPEGRVIQATINSRTNTANASLRRAALDAARKAVFNKVSTVNNQQGTITYYFKLK